VPTISGITTIGAAPVELTIDFGPTSNLLDADPTSDMFSVTNGYITGITTVVPKEKYTFVVASDGSELPIEIQFPENSLQDEYGNWNVVSPLTHRLEYNTGIPTANFSTIDTAYFEPQGYVAFHVISGLGDTEPYIYHSGVLISSPTNAHETFEVNTLQRAAASVAFNPTGNIYTVNGFPEGEYAIRIPLNAIRNQLGSGIQDTTYRFKVYNLALSHTGVHDFGTQNEGYPAITPQAPTITNNGVSLTAPGLSVSVTGADAADFVLNTSGMLINLPPGIVTSFRIAPRTGLLERAAPYTATVTIRSNGKEIGHFDVTFTVTKLPPPNAIIDYVNETFTNLGVLGTPGNDTTYVFNGGVPVIPDDDGTYPIDESWMNDIINGLTNAKVEPGSSGLSMPQYITVPSRPAAPALLAQNASNTNANDGSVYGLNDSMQYKVGDTGEWIDIVSIRPWLEDLAPGVYYFRYRAIQDERFASFITTITIKEELTPAIIREVVLPETPGVVIEPRPGSHFITSGQDFLFTLLVEGDTPPTVKTDRFINGRQEVLTGTANGTGGYDYLIPSVRDMIRVEITAASANETLRSANVWAYEGVIFIEVQQRTEVDVYTVSGVLFKRLTVAEGLTGLKAAQGVYIVALPDGTTQKVIVK
jgi:hypothetical protein